MNNFLRNFIMKTIIEMIEKDVAEWQVRQYALGWYTKQVLTEEDLAVIEQKYIEKAQVEDNAEIVEEVQATEETEDAGIEENSVETAESEVE